MRLQRTILLFNSLLFACSLFSQVQSDLSKSVPAWLDYDTTTNQATLKWIMDDLATQYTISELDQENNTLTALETIDGSLNEYAIGELTPGETYGYHIAKSAAAPNGVGILSLGLSVPATHARGRCLIAIDDTLALPLLMEINRLTNDLEMDGWVVDTLHIARTLNDVAVKQLITNWYQEDYLLSQSLFLLGRIAVPYSGNNAHDGHTNHQGAWAADTYYGDMDGNWTDTQVDNTSPSREANKNIPGDGKYDQTGIPGAIELEVGRVDFHNLPAFPEDEIELTRNYLNKNHDFRIGNKDYPRRAIVENNFSNFAEGFGQSGWRSFTTMFGADSVSVGNYDVVLNEEKYLCSYACGGGSYTSASGIGSTNNLWVAKDIQTVFTMNFGSYFGDWDSQNNFLRASLGSGDVLTNAWAGRPVWHLYTMSLGKHIGFSARQSQNAIGFVFNQGFSARSTHMALLGDPTLRLHALKPASALDAQLIDGDVVLNWTASPEAEEGYFVYRKTNGEEWELLEEFYSTTNFIDPCIAPNNTYEYQVKAIRLEHTGSGTYFNTSLGIATVIQIENNPALTSFFLDADMDNFGNGAIDTLACEAPPGFVANDLDCDDTNPAINPDEEEIPDNDIDENCDGEILMTSLTDLAKSNLKIYPNPSDGLLFLEAEGIENFHYRIFNSQGSTMQSGKTSRVIQCLDFPSGTYWLQVNDDSSPQSFLKKIVLER